MFFLKYAFMNLRKTQLMCYMINYFLSFRRKYIKNFLMHAYNKICNEMWTKKHADTFLLSPLYFTNIIFRGRILNSLFYLYTVRILCYPYKLQRFSKAKFDKFF